METTICNEMESCSCLSEGTEGQEDTKTKMQVGMEKCMKSGKWFLLIPGILLSAAFLLTFFLNPESVQVLWLVITGTLLGLGLTFMLLATLWFSNVKKDIKA